MGARRGFKGLTEIDGLTDEQIGELVLGNWHKLNAVLRTRPSVASLRRLFILEAARGSAARGNFLERLRGAIAAGVARESTRALGAVSRALARFELPSLEDLVAAGLDEPAARDLERRLVALAQPPRRSS